MPSGLFLLLDDITTLLDDVAVLSKIAAKKTAGVLGDDLALNAEQVSGVNADRELPVVWAVAKGSFVNKLILIPSALLISAFIPWAVVPLLMLGGAYLCFEGFEKILDKGMELWSKRKQKKSAATTENEKLAAALTHLKENLTAEASQKIEKEKIRGAIRTDFILSAEIVVITLGTLTEVDFPQRLLSLCVIGLAMTVGVYGLVAAIVKLDDAGLYLIQQKKKLSKQFGLLILKLAPWLMKSLSIAGTVAMFVVGGGIISHGWPDMHNFMTEEVESYGLLATSGLNIILGLLIGGLVYAAVHPAMNYLKKRKPANAK